MRLLRRMLVLIVLGCVTTVAVAWGCAWQTIRSGSLTDVSGVTAHVQWWRRNAPADWRETPGAAVRSRRGFGRADYLYTEFSEMEFEHTGTLGDNMTRRRSGWPVLSMEGHSQIDRGAQTHETRMLFLFSGVWFLRPAILPLRPIWPGFVIDALFYSAIWFGIFLSFGSARKAIRKGRGRCPKCAYQLRGQFDAGCSECGWNR